MKPTLDWLADFVDLPTRDPQEIAAGRFVRIQERARSLLQAVQSA